MLHSEPLDFLSTNFSHFFLQPGQNISACALPEPDYKLDVELVQDAVEVLPQLLHARVLGALSQVQVLCSLLLTRQHHVEKRGPDAK